jgi:hypothetical protein
MAYIPQSRSLAQNLTTDAVTAASPFLEILGKSMGYENLGYDKKQSRGAAVLGDKALQDRLRYGQNKAASEDVAKMEFEKLHGPGSYDALRSATGFNTAQVPQQAMQQNTLQPTNETPEQRKNSEFLDKINQLASVYQNRLLGQTPQSFEQPKGQQPSTQQFGMQQPGMQQGIPSRMDLLGGQLPQGFQQLAQQGGIPNEMFANALQGLQGRQQAKEEEQFAQQQTQQQVQRQQAELSQQEEQRYQQELETKEKFEPKPEDYKQLAQEVDAMENLPEGIKKRKIAQYTKEAANLQKKQDKINADGAKYDKALEVQEKAASQLKDASAKLREYVTKYPQYFGSGPVAKATRNRFASQTGNIEQAINSFALEKLPSLPGAARGGKALLEALFRSKPGWEMTPDAILEYLDHADKTSNKMLGEVERFNEVKLSNNGNLPSYWKEFATGKYIPVDKLKELGSPKNFSPDAEIYDDETDTVYRVVHGDWRIV